MFRSVAIIAMWQEYHKPILNIPFCFPGAQELIDDDLSTVYEVAELCFPKSKGVWMGLSVSKLVAENGKL